MDAGARSPEAVAKRAREVSRELAAAFQAHLAAVQASDVREGGGVADLARLALARACTMTGIRRTP